MSVADFVGVSKTTAGRIVHDVSRAIARLYGKYVFMHQNAAEKFFELAGFPRVLGAVDGTHIHIQCPCKLQSPSNYIIGMQGSESGWLGGG